MNTLKYPAIVTKDSIRDYLYILHFPDFPEAITVVEYENILDSGEAELCLCLAIEKNMRAGILLPVPSKLENAQYINVSKYQIHSVIEYAKNQINYKDFLNE